MAKSIPNACGAFEFIYLSQFIPAMSEHGLIVHLTLTEDHSLCGGQGRRRGKGFLASSNLKHLWLSGAVKGIWLKQIKVRQDQSVGTNLPLLEAAPLSPGPSLPLALSSLSPALLFFSLFELQ